MSLVGEVRTHSQLPPAQAGVLPEQTAQAAPQCLASSFEQPVQTPELHHRPSPHFESASHCAHTPDVHQGSDVPSQRAQVAPQCRASSLVHEVHSPALHHLPTAHCVSNSQKAHLPATHEGDAVPVHRAQAPPQCAGSSSEQPTQAPALHHWPVGQCVSWTHWTHMWPTQ